MSHTAQHVAKQATWLMLASTLQKAISFAAFTAATYYLGAESVGIYFYLLSLSSLAGAWTDLGLTPVIIRAFAADAERGWGLVRRATTAKLLLVPAAAIISFGYVALFHNDGQSLLPLLAIALLVMAEDTCSLLAYGILRGKGQLHKESLGMVLGQLLSSGALVLLVKLGFGVTGALIALALGSTWQLVWSFFQVRGYWRDNRHSQLPPWKTLLREAMPFALAGLFVRVYSAVDALLLKRFYGATEVGNYAVAYKLTYALQFIPMAFVAALYPSLSAAYAKKDEVALTHTALGSWRFMAIVGFPLAAGISGFAPRLIELIYKAEFAPAAQILVVLAWALPILFLDFPVGSYLNATHKADQKTFAMGCTMVVNALANVLLIPVLGGVGAAIAALCGYLVLLGVGMWYSRTTFASATAWSVLLRGVLVGASVWALIVFGLHYLPLIPALVVAPVAALLILYATKLVQTSDLREVFAWVTKRV